MESQDQLKQIKAALNVLRTAPGQQELTDKLQPLAESLLMGEIREDEFREALAEINYQKSRTAALILAKTGLTTQLHELEAALSKQELSGQRQEALAAARAAEANRPAKKPHDYGPRLTADPLQEEHNEKP